MSDAYSKNQANPDRRHVRRYAALLALVGATGCVSNAHLSHKQAAAPTFDAIAFFSGHTEGKGVLKVLLHRAEGTLVEGSGQVVSGNTIVLDQSVKRGRRSTTHRQWKLRAEADGGYVGTLTDAVGPVVGIVDGNRLHLAFAMKGGLKAKQWLYLAPDRMSARNVVIVSKFGLPVAQLDETITRTAN